MNLSKFASLRMSPNRSKNINKSKPRLKLDPSLEKSLNKMNDFDNFSKNDILASR